jgi:putative toxin-antitoxin system antitoxin component (TIGR02293 family)
MTRTTAQRAREFARASPLEAHERVQRGIPLSEVTRFVSATELTQEEAASLLGLPVRTYQRWLAEPGKKLDPSTGGRYYRTVKVIQHAATLLGSLESALEWLRSGHRALAGRVPFDLLATDPGAEAVEDLLGRIEYGVIT